MRNVIAAFAACVLLHAQTQPQEPPASQQFHAWLRAFNSDNPQSLRDFLARNYPSRPPGMDDDGFRKMTGGFDFKKAEESTDTSYTALIQERSSDQFARAHIEVEQNPPFHITRLDIAAIPRPAGFEVPAMGEKELVDAVQKHAEQDAAADTFSGAVLIAHDGKTVFARAWGLADREHKIPNTVDTKFRIGSMNKMFTATAILQLAQAGKIDLQQPFGKYITDYPNHELASTVTIHQLLTHTGGTGDIFGPEFNKHRLDLKTLDDYIKLYGSRGPEFKPGSEWRYSNYGFEILGVVIERVSGVSYYDYVRDHIYKVAGMTSSGSLPENEPVPNRSIGYTKFRDATAWHPNTDTLPWRGTSAGGGYSTVKDLAAFAEAILNHKLLNAQYTDLLTSGKVDARGAKYAYGFEDFNQGGVRWFGHGGGAPGMNGDLKIYPKMGYVIAVLANLDPPAAQRISEFIANRLPH